MALPLPDQGLLVFVPRLTPWHKLFALVCTVRAVEKLWNVSLLRKEFTTPIVKATKGSQERHLVNLSTAGAVFSLAPVNHWKGSASWRPLQTREHATHARQGDEIAPAFPQEIQFFTLHDYERWKLRQPSSPGHDRLGHERWSGGVKLHSRGRESALL